LWSSTFDWQTRAHAWDQETDRVSRAAFLAELVEQRKRHARALQACQQIAILPTRAALDAIQSSDMLQQLTARATGSLDGFLGILKLAREFGLGLPSLVQAERLISGESTAVIATEKREMDFSFADKVAKSPAAVHLATQLLDEIAGVPPGSHQSDAPEDTSE
jgi:hypothetical protein